MAKDRAHDLRRRPSINLGVGKLGGGGELKEPKSHVEVLEDDPMRHVSYGSLELAKEQQAAYEAERDKA